MSRLPQFRHLTRATLTFLFACAVAAALFAGSGEPATAATFTVTKTADTADGTCDADCSLREAVIAANAAPGLDTINLPSGTFSLTIVGGGEDSAATGDLDVTDNLTINGAGLANTTIEVGAGDDRIFDVINTLPIITLLTATDLEIRNGKGDVGFGCECGGGILVRTDAWLRLVNTAVVANSATGGSLSTGGGIENGGTATLENSFILGNSADFAGGINNGPNASFTMTGGAIEANTASTSVGGVELPPGSAATMIGVLIARNTAGSGAGGFDVSGSLELINSSVIGNTAGGNGGGLDVSGGTVTASGSSIVDNVSAGDGGGIFSNGDVTLTNTTISSNDPGGIGAGILNNVVGNLTATNVTIAGNNPPSGLHNFGTATLKNTIVGSNHGADCIGPAAITSLGHNLDSDGTCGLAGPGDIPNRDPRLAPLDHTSGPTQWHPLLADSPAIDAGDSVGCPATDQRGVARPIDGNNDGISACDIGAFEFGQPGTITIVKDAIPNGPGLFAFAVTEGACPPAGPTCTGFTFNLDDDDATVTARSNSFTRTPGTIAVQESSTPAGWTLTTIACSDGSRTDVATKTASVDLAAGENVTCTFTNTLGAAGSPATPSTLPGTGGGDSGSAGGISATALAVIAVPMVLAVGGAVWRARRRIANRT